MKARALSALALILLPGVLSAQRVILPPRIGGPGPVLGPNALPPQAPVIARQLAYRRLPFAIESYPLISYINAPGLGSISQATSWTTFGMGTRLDYRLTRFVSATVDMTQSFLGGPMNTQTVELGTRFRPPRTERRFYPFADLRIAYANSYATYGWPNDIYGNSPALDRIGGVRYSRGFGGVAGVGVEFGLTRTLSLTSAATLLQSYQNGYRYNFGAPADVGYNMSAYRYTFGLRWNPVRVITVAQPPAE